MKSKNKSLFLLKGNPTKRVVKLISRLSIYGFAFLLLFVTSCKKKDDTSTNTPKNLGWLGNDNPNAIPVAVNGSNLGFGNQSVPASYDLIPKFPPVGDQGQYGTCVAWATGYNYKTALEGMARGLNTGALAQANNQLSPKDLFIAIPDSKKGADCNGTDFTDALDVTLNRGVATMQTVPYTNLNGCSQGSGQGSWATEAAGHKIANYRRIAVDAATIKSCVSNNIPVIFGARLGDNFMTWNSDAVITGHSGFDNVGIHAYHALVVAGYDDSKGPNGAYRVINSWNSTWGDQGHIWVDYNFFASDFCYGGNCFIATNGTSDSVPDVNPNTSGVDLAPWAFADYSTTSTTGYSNSRRIEYNVYNIGSQVASSSSNWGLYYIYYNAYDATDYGFLFFDEFNTSIAVNTYDCPTNDHCIINLDIPAGNDLGTVGFGTSSLYQDYLVPTSVTGEYYLLLYADASDAIAESDEQNNYFYTTDQYPVYFQNGTIPRFADKTPVPLSSYKLLNPGTPGRERIKASEFKTAVNTQNPNAYSSKEIKQFLLHEVKTGNFQNKLEQFKAQQKVLKTGMRGAKSGE